MGQIAAVDVASAVSEGSGDNGFSLKSIPLCFLATYVVPLSLPNANQFVQPVRIDC